MKLKSVNTIRPILAPGTAKPRDYFAAPDYEIVHNDQSGVIYVKDTKSGRRKLIGSSAWMDAEPIEEPKQELAQQQGKR